jgi:hypothetical protein
MLTTVCRKRFGRAGSLLAQMQKVLKKMVNPEKKGAKKPKPAVEEGGGDEAAEAGGKDEE